MALAKITQVAGRGVYVPGSDIDTDRIIPARFMKCVTFDGLGEFAFYDARFDKEGKPTGHPLDDPRFQGANILLSGTNFGCGSSREHAPQALYRFGIRAVIAESFAEIFFGNCTTLGIPCVCASGADIQVLAKEIERNPQLEVTVDLAAGKVFFEDQEIAITLPSTAHEALTSGQWDPIAELLENKDAVHERITALGFA
ncbi:MAG: 3-isopropylmalate dehydratase small subunit [Prosthecobacter sp.]|jgi:3-isopropylmalate/(R)-2-methylmalate dehydratase small subunit|uniref:3-isopropylmalate dehydratase small subunit n=1 Tax=Prosthecobacter sp. TaxID=1965333 RepID=UPI0019DC6308|nr:3-isopropylmalate dehydratase small subunit [Prosthecobacter sp.]MBE2284732.1 3-isopropylmalate dehydratase small subunit [Prosthecobacter sp.]